MSSILYLTLWNNSNLQRFHLRRTESRCREFLKMRFACSTSSRNFNKLKLFGNKTKLRMLESRNFIPFFSYLPIEMAKLKPRETLSRRNNKVYIFFLQFWYDWMSDETSCGVSGRASQVKNRTFYSCVLSILAFEWTWDWGWLCFDTNLLPFQM